MRAFRFFGLVIACVAMLIGPAASRSAQAQPSESPSVLMVVVSRASIAEASDIALFFRPSFPATSVQQSPNGYYAVTLGAFRQDVAKARKAQWIAAGAIPTDTYLSYGNGFSAPLPLQPSGKGPQAPPLDPSAPGVARVDDTCSLANHGAPVVFRHVSGNSNFAVCSINVPEFSIAVITAYRVGGSGTATTYFVEAVEKTADGHVQGHGVIAKDSTRDNFPSVTTLPPSSEATRRTVFILANQDDAAAWNIQFHTVDLRRHFVDAIGSAVGTEIMSYLVRSFLGTESDDSDNRNATASDLTAAFELAWSGIHSNSVLSAGWNVFMTNIQIKLADKFPNDSFVINTCMNFIRSVADDVYGPAFAAMQH